MGGSKAQTTCSKFPIYASAVNAESRMKFLGAWRPILRNMLEYKRRHGEVSKSKLLRSILSQHLDKVDLVLELFGVTTGIAADAEADAHAKAQILGSLTPEEQMKNLSASHPIGFVLRDKYDNLVTNSMLDLVEQFVKDFMGEEQADSGSSSESQLASELQSYSAKRAKYCAQRHN